MSECDISCKVLTPTLVHGSDDKSIELRTDFFEESIRYWWRAIIGIDNKNNLKNKELALFGGEEDEGKESPLKLRIGYMKFNKSRYYPISKTGKVIKNHTKEALMPGSRYSLYLYTRNNINIYRDLAILSFVLGGLGKNNNFGYGVSMIENIDYRKYEVYNFGREITNILNRVCEGEAFKIIDEDTKWIIERKRGINTDYPAIEKIEIGKQYTKWDKLIDRAENYSKFKNKPEIDNIDERKEVLSTIYVSCYESRKHVYPIITTLKPCLRKGMNLSRVKIEEYQDDFKSIFF